MLTATVLGAHLVGWTSGLRTAIALTVGQGVHLGLRARSPFAFPVQVRAAYLAVLLLGGACPLAALHWAQLAGTIAVLTADYCPLARTLSLLPWNRRKPLTLSLIKATFLTPPVRGSIVDALNDHHLSGGSRP